MIKYINFPILLLSFLITVTYLQCTSTAKVLVIKSPNPNNLDTIYTDEFDHSIKYKYKQKHVECEK